MDLPSDTIGRPPKVHKKLTRPKGIVNERNKVEKCVNSSAPSYGGGLSST